MMHAAYVLAWQSPYEEVEPSGAGDDGFFIMHLRLES
jgi:hypothetical protein